MAAPTSGPCRWYASPDWWYCDYCFRWEDDDDNDWMSDFSTPKDHLSPATPNVLLKVHSRIITVEELKRYKLSKELLKRRDKGVGVGGGAGAAEQVHTETGLAPAASEPMSKTLKQYLHGQRQLGYSETVVDHIHYIVLVRVQRVVACLSRSTPPHSWTSTMWRSRDTFCHTSDLSPKTPVQLQKIPWPTSCLRTHCTSQTQPERCSESSQSDAPGSPSRSSTRSLLPSVNHPRKTYRQNGSRKWSAGDNKRTALTLQMHSKGVRIDVGSVANAKERMREPHSQD
jgi:hypothetical protein